MNLKKDSTITEDCEKIVMINFVNGEQLRITCSDFYFNEDDTFAFEDSYGNICALVPKGQVVCICDEKYIYR